MTAVGILLALYVAFLLWHEPWFSRPLRPGEAAAVLQGRYDDVAPDERAAFEAFLDRDDGRPFYMVNLMQYRTTAAYRDGLLPDGTPKDWRCPQCGHFNFFAAAGASGTCANGVCADGSCASAICAGGSCGSAICAGGSCANGVCAAGSCARADAAVYRKHLAYLGG
jgi:hypothetical protein